jgi:hypothetical protein
VVSFFFPAAQQPAAQQLAAARFPLPFLFLFQSRRKGRRPIFTARPSSTSPLLSLPPADRSALLIRPFPYLRHLPCPVSTRLLRPFLLAPFISPPSSSPLSHSEALASLSPYQFLFVPSN